MDLNIGVLLGEKSIKLKNPLVLSSGILDTNGKILAKIGRDAGAVTTKSLGMKKREGHKNPVVAFYEHGMLNSMGLPNPGAKNFIDEIKYAKQHTDAKIIASIFGRDEEEYGRVAEIISEARPDIIEANVSCPNVKFKKMFGANIESVKKIVKEIKKKTKIPLIVKLSPNTANLKEIAEEVEKAGGDGISAINTVGPGMLINAEAGKPVLSTYFGGVSGPAVKPIALRCVYEIYESVSIPIIGIGGVLNGKDAIEMMMAGASLVGIGSGVHYRGENIFKKVLNEMEKFMKENGYENVEEIIGIAHKK